MAEDPEDRLVDTMSAAQAVAGMLDFLAPECSLDPANGTPAVYRVRIGKFTTRREAESVAARLKKEEQFNPWITR